MINIKIILRGIGQVFFQNNALTGFIFLIGIFYNSWILGLGALVGNIIGTYSAKLFKYNKEDIGNGLYGFNGTLVGVGVLFFFSPGLVSIVGVVVGSIFSSVIMHFLKNKIPVYTFPFVLSLWFVFYLFLLIFPSSFLNSQILLVNKINIFSVVTKNFGQVMFQNNIITGLIFMIGIIVNSFKDFKYAFYGSFISFIFAILLLISINDINMGLLGYNAVLTGIAIGGLNLKNKNLISITLGIFLSVLIYLLFEKLNIIPLTAPFVMATWIVLFVNKKLITI